MFAWRPITWSFAENMPPFRTLIKKTRLKPLLSFCCFALALKDRNAYKIPANINNCVTLGWIEGMATIGMYLKEIYDEQNRAWRRIFGIHRLNCSRTG
jgi:hypothetical protein